MQEGKIEKKNDKKKNDFKVNMIYNEKGELKMDRKSIWKLLYEGKLK